MTKITLIPEGNKAVDAQPTIETQDQKYQGSSRLWQILTAASIAINLALTGTLIIEEGRRSELVAQREKDKKKLQAQKFITDRKDCEYNMAMVGQGLSFYTAVSTSPKTEIICSNLKYVQSQISVAHRTCEQGFLSLNPQEYFYGKVDFSNVVSQEQQSIKDEIAKQRTQEQKIQQTLSTQCQ